MQERNGKQYFVSQATLHPSMEPQDVYKLIFQAAFGAEHLLQDEDVAWHYFQKEYEAVSPREEALYEQIQETTYRVNLRAWKQRELPMQWLFRMFVGSVRQQKAGSEQHFAEYEQGAKEAAREGLFPFSEQAFSEYAMEYKKTGLRAVHHSEAYRAAEAPAYRLVSGTYVRLLPILEAMAARTEAVVAIDGRCASGKSTAAELLSEITGAGVIHMDDFYLPVEMRTPSRLAEPGGNVHYERFREEVIPRLKGGSGFSYRRFDCSRMVLGEEREVATSPYMIVEGAYSCHPLLGDYMDVKVFSDIESGEQLRRIGERDGEKYLSAFQERWIPMEENYFSAYPIKETADILI